MIIFNKDFIQKGIFANKKMIQKKTIVYIAFGELYIAMALLSIKTLKEIRPNH